MSGFVGIVHFDGAPVDPRLLRNLTQSLSFRGPDAQEMWCDGSVGLGHALLQIPRGAPLEKQPASLDSRLWVVADARVDARDDLIGKLKGKSGVAGTPSRSTPDAQLILHAYDVWGECCVDHLMGDFVFAIWDARRQRLFCARDHFGVKQLYYAKIASGIVFCNTLNTLRLHSGVSSRLNDLAIADFLLFDANQDPTGTSFAGINQVAPAHTLVSDRDVLCARRYWTLPIAEPIATAPEADCVKQFRELLDTAVADRVRGASVGIMMSGGLDSTVVAASAQRILSQRGNGAHVRAYTEVYDSLIPHEERRYATLAANALRIPIEFLVSDGRRIFERAEEPGYRLPWPIHLALPDTSTDQLKQISRNANVALTGFGADPAFCARITVHFRESIRKGRVDRALFDAARYMSRPGRSSRLYVKTRWQRLFPPSTHAPSYPPWLNPNLEKMHSLHDRWMQQLNATTPNKSIRPEAYQAIANPQWTNCFEANDSGITQVPVEVCHPFFDLRMVQFLLALPRLPWCCDKELLREVLRGSLPDAVRLRRKSPLLAEPLNAILSGSESAWVDDFLPTEDLEHYVSRRKVPPVHHEKETWAAWTHLRPLSLNFWLHMRDF